MKQEPLAYRMSPLQLDEFVGQEHILGHGKMLRRMIQADQLSSIILFGPPGTGKTSLARIIANTTKATFRQINAVTSGIKEIKSIVEESTNYLMNPSGRMVLFVDEIHRFNKAQQDALLPHVENGNLILIGATTENPYFEVNKALLSRSTVFQLYPLSQENIREIIERTLTDPDRGLGGEKIRLHEEAKAFLAEISQGDARTALNAIELAWMTTSASPDGWIDLTAEVIHECVQKKPLRYDADGEDHYDTISAFIKSMRGSDPDAAVFYLARMLEAGEDPAFVARRVVICAAEDVGMANPQALSMAVAAWQATEMIGMPEARIVLAQAVIMVATSPKSNKAYLAVDKALADVRTRDTGEIPFYLRNAPVKEMQSNLGYSNGYKYAHDYPQSIAPLEFLPERMRGTHYYEPTDNGYEAKVSAWLKVIDERLHGGDKKTK